MSEKPLNRESLKSMFSEGARPSENNFGSLIDSMVNKVDDGISKNLKDGLILSPEGKESDRLVSFYKNLQDDRPDWSIEMLKEKNYGLAITEPTGNGEAKVRLFFAENGNVGIGTDEPLTPLTVNGVSSSKGRMGTYKMGTVPADRKWHDLVTGLDNCTGFEVVAQVGKPKAGRYALMHANAVCTFGKSHSKIRCTQAHYGWWWNKIALRWVGTTHNYSLQIRTRSNYGAGEEIKYSISQLWDKNFEAFFQSNSPV